MALSDEYDDYPAAEEAPWSPRIEFDGTSGYVQTAALPVGADIPEIIAGLLAEIGYEPGTLHIGRILRASHWQQRARVRTWSEEEERYVTSSEFETVWLHAVKVEILPGSHLPATDIEAVITATRKKPPATHSTGHWFVFQGSDQQLGKISRDGSTEQIIERYIQSVDTAKTEFKRLKRLGIEGIQICLPGDCIEGNQSQNGKNMWLTKETVPEQIRILRRLMLHTVETFAPLVDQIYLDVVNGNHDQADRRQNSYPGDGWATEAAIALSDAMKLNPTAYGHVEVRVPDKWQGHMTVPVGDTVCTIAHGHQWRRRERAMTWWAEQAVHNQAPGGAHLLQAGHYHTFALEGHATKTVVYSPTFDLGSDWFRESHGAESQRGGLIYLLQAGTLSNLSVV